MAPYWSNERERTLLRVLHYAYPIVLLFGFLIAFTVRSILLSNARSNQETKPLSPAIGPNGKPVKTQRPPTPIQTVPLDFSKPRKLLFDWLSLFITGTFLANAANVIVHALAKRDEGWWCGKAVVFYVVGSFFVYSLILISLLDTKPAPTTAHLSTWLLAIIMEATMLGASISLYTNTHREPHLDPPTFHSSSGQGRLQTHMTSWEAIEVLIAIVRIVMLIAQAAFYLLFVISRNAHIRRAKAASSDAESDETTGLLSEPQIPAIDITVARTRDVEAQREQAASREVQAEAPTREAQDAEGEAGSPTNKEGQNLLRAEEDTTSAVQQGISGPGAGDESRPLLANGHVSTTSGATDGLNGSIHKRKSYGSIKPSSKATDASKAKAKKKEEPAGWERPNTVPARDWWEYIRGYSVLFPYLWPSKDRKLQVLVVICFLIMVVQRVLNILVPNQVGLITNDLAGENGPVHMPWGAICLYIFFRLLQGGNGLLSAARSVLWLPVSQYSYRELSVAAFEHVHGLSLDFHLGKKTGEVVSALGKGASINSFLENVTFQVLPMIVDLVVAIWYFLVYFDAYYALTIAIVTFWYIYITIRMAQWRNEMRRQMTNADRAEEAVKNDSMLSYETVKYFNAERWEFQRYTDAVNTYLKAEYSVNFSLNLMNVAQNMIFMLGLLTTAFILAYQITTGQQNVGKFTTLLIYMGQLQQPLNFFGTFYRVIQSAMINSERMLELFKEQPTVVDKSSASPLASCQGRINFNQVRFAYDPRKPALDGMSFEISPGTTTAFVGESGGGKSTVFRLLFRFYNQESGSIQVDGHDVRELTIDSLRKHIGVVPQDTILFNETIMYNLKYANQHATDEMVFDACRAASIHDRIINFPDGYETKVGERGLRLSGGEKQRVAIARTIIKNPRIILLDEATAALDTETEQHIQQALTRLSQGRTMLVIAHRLSTITTADQIIVLHRGKVAEKGTHEELLEKKGRYAGMWEKQVKAQKAAEEAKKAKDRAEQLRKEMQHDSASQSEDEAGPSGSGSNSGNGSGKGRHGHSPLASVSALGDGGGSGKPSGHP